MRSKVIDTNVLMVANEMAPQAKAECVTASIEALVEVQRNGRIVLDETGLILKEYADKAFVLRAAWRW